MCRSPATPEKKKAPQRGALENRHCGGQGGGAIVAAVQEMCNPAFSGKSVATPTLLVAGASIGWLAWHPGATQWWLLALPVMWATSRSRLGAAALWMGYYLAGARDVPAIYPVFFPGAPWGILVWLIHAGLLALPWAMLWRANRRHVALAAATALLVSALPPLGVLGWLSPLLLAGEAFPGMGWVGLAATITMLSFAAAVAAVFTVRSLLSLLIPALLALLLACSSVVAHVMETPAHPPVGYVGIDTALGKYPAHDIRAAYQYHQTLITAVERQLHAGATVVVLPEEIAGIWRPGTQFWWRGTEKYALEKNAVIVLGADLPASGKRYFDGAVLLGGNGVIRGRVPMPIGVWKPGTGTGGVPDFLGLGLSKVQGATVALSICYEDFLVYPFLWAMPGSPSVVVSLANNWFARDLAAAIWIQRRSIENQARLFGLPLVRAVNLDRH